MTTDYVSFLTNKALLAPTTGIEQTPPLSPHLFPFQRDIVRWALTRGRAAIFAGCGLGKTAMQLEWARVVTEETGGRVLILAPLAVAQQTVAEGVKFGIDVRYVRHGSEIDIYSRGPVWITNYEMLSHFDADAFVGVVLDESSLLKSFDGKTRTQLIEMFARTRFKLACTATPAPNDHMELGNHAEFLGIMTRAEMLAMFFVHDGGETQKWRVKGHGAGAFWKWVCSWAVTLRKPSDLGYEDEGFNLPPLEIAHDIVEGNPDGAKERGLLFDMEAQTLDERRAARRVSIDQRVAKAAALVNKSKRPWLVWCDFNAEGDALEKAIPGSVQVSGSDDREWKQNAALWFVGQYEEPCECEARKRNEPTCASTTSGTSINGKSGALSNASDTTLPAEQGTRQTKTSDPKRERKPRGGSRAIQTNSLPSGSESMDSHQSSTIGSMQHRMGVAQFVDEPSRSMSIQNRGNAADCMSIIATDQDKCGDSFARPVIWESESSETAQKSLSERPCTCGKLTRTRRKVLISKSSVFGFGLNFQHCSNIAFVGISDSFEGFYQAVRRCWRFGQKRPVKVHVITSPAEGSVVRNIKRKEADADRMYTEMVKNMAELNTKALKGATRDEATYETDTSSGQGWTIQLGDAVDLVRTLATESIDYSIFSPPFASLYTYSNSDRDMGNARTHQEFYEHFRFLVPELLRATKPGRLLSFHCMNLPTSKTRDGVIGLTDFRGIMIRAFTDAGWIYHSEVCIWKDPVTAMQRTKALGLLHKQIKKDSCMSRQGIPDYLVTMRKPGINPEPVTHTNETFPVAFWQRYASPVWFDIDPTKTLSYREARENDDERHICPLQLQVIERAIDLWTNPGDLVLSPFAGIGSEGYVALERGRRFHGFELKRAYYQTACRNLASVDPTKSKRQLSMFDAGVPA